MGIPGSAVSGGVFRRPWVPARIYPKLLQDRVEHPVRALDGVLEFRSILDHVVGRGHLVRGGRLGAHALQNLLCVAVIAVERSDHLHVFWCCDHHQRSELLCAPGLDQERGLVTGEWFFAELQTTDLDLQRGLDPRMNERFESLPDIAVGEDQAGQLGAIDRQIFMQDLVTKLSEQRPVAVALRSNNCAREQISVDDRELARTEARCHGAFAGTDPSGQSKDLTRHGWKLARLRGRRGAQSAACLALVLALGVGVDVARGEVSSPSSEAGDWPVDPLWDTGSALAGEPRVGPTGEIALLGVAGTLDLLEFDGNLRFRITLPAAPTGAALIDERGRIFVPTLPRTVVAVGPQGRTMRRMLTPRAPLLDLHWVKGYGLVSSAGSRHLVGLTRHGVVTLMHKSPTTVSGQPVAVGDDLAWVGADGCLWWIRKGQPSSTVRLDGPVLALKADGHHPPWLWVRTAERVLAFDRRKRVFSGQRALLMAPLPKPEAQVVVLVERGPRATWYDRNGQRLASVGFEGEKLDHAGAVTDCEGRLWLSAGDGSLLILAPNGVARRLGGFGRGPLFLVLDCPRHRLLVGERSGRLTSVSWRAPG